MTAEQRRADFLVHDKSHVVGTFKAIDAESNRVRVNQLQTPNGTYESAVLRGSDIEVIDFDLAH